MFFLNLFWDETREVFQAREPIDFFGAAPVARARRQLSTLSSTTPTPTSNLKPLNKKMFACVARTACLAKPPLAFFDGTLSTKPAKKLGGWFRGVDTA